MKKINLRGITESLSEREMKNVIGSSNLQLAWQGGGTGGGGDNPNAKYYKCTSAPIHNDPLTTLNVACTVTVLAAGLDDAKYAALLMCGGLYDSASCFLMP